MLTKLSIISQVFFLISTSYAQTYALNYRGTRLDLLPNTSIYFPEALSETGHAGGNSRVNTFPTLPVDVGVIWNLDGDPSKLEVTEDYVGAVVMGFDPTGKPIGGVSKPSQFRKPGIWTSSGFQTLAETGIGGTAVAANTSTVFGSTGQPTDKPGVYRASATLWDRSGPRVVTGIGDVESNAWDINRVGTYVGITYDFSDPNDAVYGGFVGRNGSAQKLSFPGFPETRAFEINDDNWIVGMWESNNTHRRGYTARVNLDTGEQEIHDLGLFPGYNETIAYAINNDRTMVGGALESQFGGFDRAMIWFNGSLTPQDLNDYVNLPGVTLIDAYRINNAGQILAEARLDDGSGYAYYRLDPIVPEPAGSAAVLTGSLLAIRRRVRR